MYTFLRFMASIFPTVKERRGGGEKGGGGALLRAVTHHNALGFQVSLQRGLSQVTADAAGFVPTKRNGRIKRVVRVDPHCTADVRVCVTLPLRYTRAHTHRHTGTRALTVAGRDRDTHAHT